MYYSLYGYFKGGIATVKFDHQGSQLQGRRVSSTRLYQHIWDDHLESSS